MPQQRTITNRAEDKKAGMTLGDLIAFVQECERADLPRTAQVHVQCGWRAQLQQVEARHEAAQRGESS